METMTPPWVKLLPIQLRGGPESDARNRAEASPDNGADVEVSVMAPLSMERDVGKCPHMKGCPHSKKCGGKTYAAGGSVHTAKWDRCVKKVRAKGNVSSPEAICTKSLGESGKLKKGKAKGGAVGTYETKAGGYTGSEEDGTIVADKEVNEKTFVDHQGEFYVNAPLTQILGGPDAVEKMLISRAKAAIDGKRMPNRALPAITDTKSAGLARSPGSSNKPGMQIGGRVKQRGEIDLTGVRPVESTPTITPVSAGTIQPVQADTIKSFVSATQPATQPKTTVQPAIMPAPSPAPLPVSSGSFQFDTAAPTPAPTPTPTPTATPTVAPSFTPTAPAPITAVQAKPAAQVQPMSFSITDEEIKAQTDIDTINKTLPASEGGVSTFELIGQKLGRKPTPEEMAFLTKATKTQMAEYLGSIGAYTPEQVKAVKDEAVMAGTASATPPATAYDQQVKLALKRLEDLANGKDPVMQQIIDSTMQQFGSDTAAGSEALRMQLANQGITGPAAMAIMNSYARNARIGAGQLTSNFALQVAKDAQAAGQQLLQTGLEQQAVERGYTTAEQARLEANKDAERAYTDTQRGQAMTSALSAGDYETYGRLYEQQYGVKLNTANLADVQTANKVKNATSDIMSALATNGAADFDDPALGGILKKSVQSIWEANGGTGPVPDDQAKKILEEYRVNTSPAGQMRNAISEQDAIDLFFGGDANALAQFQIAGYKAGYESFQHALPSMFTIGGIKKNADGSLDFDYDKILGAFPELEIHKALKSTDTAGTTYAVGQDMTLGGTKYKVEAVNADGSYSLDLGGVKYTATKGTTEGEWNLAKATTQAGFVKNPGKPVTLDGTEVTYNGQKVYALDGGRFNTKPDGSGMNVSLDETATSPTAAVKLTGFNVNAAGNIIGSSGAEVVDDDGFKLKPVSGQTGWARSESDGQLYRLGDDGLTAKPLSNMSIQDFTAQMDKLPAGFADEYIKSNSNTGKFETWKDDILGTRALTTADKAFVTKWINAGDSDALQYADDKVVAGDPSFYSNPLVKAKIDGRYVKLATPPADHDSAVKYLATYPAGTITMAGVRHVVITGITHTYHDPWGAGQYRTYTVSFRYLDTGEAGSTSQNANY